MEGATMIDILEGFPHSVLAFAATGGVTKKDYDDLLIPKLEEALHLALVMQTTTITDADSTFCPSSFIRRSAFEIMKKLARQGPEALASGDAQIGQISS